MKSWVAPTTRHKKIILVRDVQSKHGPTSYDRLLETILCVLNRSVVSYTSHANTKNKDKTIKDSTVFLVFSLWHAV